MATSWIYGSGLAFPVGQRQVINVVTDFGAVSGTSADQSTAFQNALDAAFGQNAIILVGQATNITAAAVSNGHFTSSTSDPLSFGTITVPSTGFGIAAIYNTGPSIGTWANATSQYELDGASAGSAVMGLVTATGATSYSNPGTTTAHGVFACWGP